MNRWFGPRWAGAICDSPPVDVPVGQRCLQCDTTIDKGDRGIITPFHGSPDDRREAIYHLWCFLRALGLDAQADEAERQRQMPS